MRGACRDVGVTEQPQSPGRCPCATLQAGSLLDFKNALNFATQPDFSQLLGHHESGGIRPLISCAGYLTGRKVNEGRDFHVKCHCRTAAKSGYRRMKMEKKATYNILTGTGVRSRLSSWVL